MSRLRVLHLAPADTARTGIASYADIIDGIFAKYLAQEVAMQRVSPVDYLDALAYARDAVVLAQIGSNEGDVFRVLRRQRSIMPGVRRIIEIHDPPQFVLSYTALLERVAVTLPGRAVRRLFDRLFGDHYARSLISPTDLFICKTAVGGETLAARFARMGVDVPVACIEHPNYLDPAPSGLARRAVPPTIGFFGYIHPDKGVHMLVDAAIRVHATRGIDAVPRIVIRGSLATPQCAWYVADMQRRVREAGLSERVTFGGFVGFDELPGFVSGLTAVALPYMLKARSSASGPLLWARTCAVPVIAHRTVVFEASVRDGVDGAIVDIGNVDEWAAVMERVATDPGWVEGLRQGITASQLYASWPAIAAQYRAALGLQQVVVR